MQVNQAAEPLYIVRPFKGKGIAGLFSTHPPIEERVEAPAPDAPEPRVAALLRGHCRPSGGGFARPLYFLK